MTTHSITVFAPTEEQSAIIQTANGRPIESLKISAYAGTGKTSTLFQVAQATRRRGLYLAFNKRNAEEAQAKFPDHIECRTTHSLAFRAMDAGRRYGRKLSERLPAWKVARELAIDPFGEIDANHIGYAAKEAISRYCQSADPVLSAWHCQDRERGLGYFVRKVVEETKLEDERRVEELARARQQQYQDYILRKARDLWERMLDIRDPCGISHDLYLKLWQLGGPVLSQYQFVMLDEAQDTNDCVLDIFLGQQAQKVLVGDAHQAIYGWRGAVNAMEKAGADNTLFLTQSFRFGEAIARAANAILAQKGEDIPALRGNPDRASTLGEIDEDQPYAVVCRSNGGVFIEALKTVRSGKSLAVIGGLKEPIELIRSAYGLMTDNRDLVTHQNIKLFESWRDFEEEARYDLSYQRLVRFVKKHGEECLVMCDELERAGETPPAKAHVVVTTGHKSKGLEWSQVRLANDFCGDTKEKPADLACAPKEEVNLLYVAATRALNRLQPNNLVERVLEGSGT